MRQGLLFSIIVSVIFCAQALGYDWSTNSGDGSEANPYQISTPEQLNSIGNNPILMNKCFRLTADIDMSIYSGSTYDSAYKIIGNKDNPFVGIFDGDGYVVSNLTVKETSTGYAGLFGMTSRESEIRNLGIRDVNVTVSGMSSTEAGGLAAHCKGIIKDCWSIGNVSVNINGGHLAVSGGLVGLSEGTIDNCWSEGSVNATVIAFDTSSRTVAGELVGVQASGTIKDCCTKGTVTTSTVGAEKFTSFSNAGGVVGRMEDGELINCSSSATVIGTATGSTWIYAGGLVGQQWDGTIQNCCCSGLVSCSCDIVGSAGGLVGQQYIGSIINSYSSGAANASVGHRAVAAGLVAWQHDTLARIENCYSTGTGNAIGSNVNKGGLIVHFGLGVTANCFWDIETSKLTTSLGGSGAKGKTTVQMQTKSTFTSAGWDFNNIWYMLDYPILQWELSPLQPLIDAAQDGDVIVIEPGVYEGRLYFNGKNITLTSVDPSDPNIVANTVLMGRGVGAVVTI